MSHKIINGDKPAPVAMIECRDCGRSIPANDDCALCGWINPNAHGVGAAGVEYRGRCSFEIGKRRCPLPGVWSEHTSGKGAMWCRVHARERHYDDTAATELEELCANPRRFLGDLRDWRDVMVDAMVGECREWARADGEARSDYVSRMQDKRRELLKEQARRLNRLPGRHVLPPAPAPEQAPRPKLTAEDAIEDAMDQLMEAQGRLEADGLSPELAARMAAEQVLRARLAR